MSYSIESLFTNVPIAETTEYILDEIYVHNKLPKLCSQLIFFNFYFAVPQPTLGHSQGDSLTNPMLINAFNHDVNHNFNPMVIGNLTMRLGP